MPTKLKLFTLEYEGETTRDRVKAIPVQFRSICINGLMHWYEPMDQQSVHSTQANLTDSLMKFLGHQNGSVRLAGNFIKRSDNTVKWMDTNAKLSAL